jgi:hypothetical protein
MTSRDIKTNRGGRPAKFAEPSRPITVTLPERVLQLLTTVDSDRAKAITKLTDASLSMDGKPQKLVSTIKAAAGKAIILVCNSEPLRRIPWLKLIEVAPARHLISIQTGTPIESMEVAIRDLLEDVPKEKTVDREILEALMRIVHTSRRTKTTTKEEILFVATDD